MSWKDAKQELFDAVSEKKQSLVFYFGSAEDDVLKEIDFAEYVDNGLVVAVVVPKPEADSGDGGEAEVEAKQSRIPDSKVTAQDLWQAYGVSKAGTFVITDCFGNETDRTTSTKIAKYLVKVGKTIKKTRQRVEGSMKAAQKAYDDGETRSALLKLHDAFSESLVGYEESDQAKELYSKILDEGRAELTQAKGNLESLEDLAQTYGDTDLEAEIKAALVAAKADS